MEAKKVWGVVLVVLGVLFVLGGIHSYSMTCFYEKEVSSMDKAMQSINKLYPKTLSQLNDPLMNILYDKNENEQLLNDAKNSSVSLLFLGVAFSVFATFLIKKNNAIPVELIEKCIKEPIMNLNFNENNQANSNEEKEKDDDTRWMHPEMRRKI